MKLNKIFTLLCLASVATSANAVGFESMFSNWITQLVSASGLLVILAGVAGGCAILFGLFKAWKSSDDQNRIEAKEIIIPFIIGGCLLAFSAIANMAAESSGGAGARTGSSSQMKF